MSKRSINGDGPELSSQEARELEEIIFSAQISSCHRLILALRHAGAS